MIMPVKSVLARFPITEILTWVFGGFLFFVVLLPRVLPFPSAFITFDEMIIGRWVSRMAQAVLTGEWQNTANPYPAVTLMWTEVAQIKLSDWLPGLSAMQNVSDVDEAIFAALPRRRLTLGLLNSIIIFATFWLLRQIFNNFVAVTATILIALDPFLLTQARVFRTDGLNGGLMMLSALAIILYAQQRQKRWLIISAVLGGLSTLTKITSFYLLLFAGFALLVWPFINGRRDFLKIIKLTIYDTFWWGVIMFGVFITLWPALWTSPAAAVKWIYDIMLFTAEDPGATWGAEQKFFFLGQIWIDDDPGLLFYLWSLAFRTTPVVLFGVLAALVGGIGLLVSQRRGSKLPDSLKALAPFWGPTMLICAYIFFYVMAMNLSASKVDRYILPVFPGLSILAAVGFVPVAAFLSNAAKIKRLGQWLVWGGVLISSAWLALPHHPYYFSYWNPLFGGGRNAANIVPVGSGEGLDVMIVQLNAMSGAEGMSLAGDADVFYNICRLTFVGHCFDETSFLTSDYFVVNFFSVQRQTIDLSTVQMVRSEGQLVRKFSKDEVDYAELYRLPGNIFPTEQWLGTHGRLRGYRLSTLEAAAGDTVEVNIYWENGEAHGWQLDDSEFFVGLSTETGQVYQTVSAQLQPEFAPFLPEASEMLKFTASLQLPADSLLGRYPLEIGLRIKAAGEETWKFNLPEPGNAITINRGAVVTSIDALSIEHRLQQSIADTGLVLLGYDDHTRQAAPHLDLYWQAIQPLAKAYRLQLALLDAQGQEIMTWSNPLAPQIHPLTNWQAGEMVKTQFPLFTTQPLPAENYRSILSLWPMDQDAGQPIHTVSLTALSP